MSELPFLKRKLTDFWSSQCLENQIEAQKDTYYRFLNHERFNWRKFVYFLALKVIAHSDDTPLKEKVLIADDSISAKTGKNIDLVSYLAINARIGTHFMRDIIDPQAAPQAP